MTFMNVQYKSTRNFSILVLKCKKNQGKVSVQTIVKLKDVLAYILVHHRNDATGYSSCISKFYLILVGKLCTPPPH